MNPIRESQLNINRRLFFSRAAAGIGTVALGSLLNPQLLSGAAQAGAAAGASPLRPPHFTPKAKRVIYLFMAGGPSQIDLLDHKPKLETLHETELPDSIRMGQ